jgi:PAS domain S-box-containing protein
VFRPSTAKDLAQALFEEAGDALILFDPESDQIHDVNPLAVRLTGYTRDELLRLQATYLFRFGGGGHGGNQRLHAAAAKTTVFHAQDGFMLRTRDEGVWIPVNTTITRLHVQPRTMALITVRDMREQHEAHQRLLRAEAELRRVLASVSDCLWSAEWPTEGKWSYRFLSPVVETLTGRPPAHFLPGLDRWREIVHPDDLDVWQAALKRMRSARDSQAEYRIRLPGGGLRWLRESVRAAHKADGQAVLLDGVVTDVTERRKAEEGLLHERQMLRTLMDNLPEAIYYKDAAGRYLVDNAAHRALLGVKSEEAARGKTVHDFFPPEQAERYHADDLAVMAAGEVSANREESIDRPDGPRLHAYTKVPLRGEDGRVSGIVCIGRDVTDEREAERRLAEERNLLLTLINNIPDHIFVKDPQGRFLIANAATLRSLGASSQEEVIGHTDFDFLPRGQAEKFAEDERQVVRTGKPMLNGEELLIDATGQAKWLLTTKVPLLSPDGGILGIVGVSHDITSRRTMEAELRRARDVAEAANRAKSDFLARMSHEIRTPMHGILGMTRLALESASDPDQRECLGMVLASADALLTIINDILDFSRIEAGKLSLEEAPFHVRDSIADAVRALALRAQQKGLELACHVAPDVPDLLIGDVGRLRQVLINLTGNAIKFTDAGEIVVRVTQAQAPEDQPGRWLHFEVSDTGIGIPKDKRSAIFEPFEQVDGSMTRKYGGTGLGLAISAQLVSLMGGRMWVESEEGRGSRFHFTAGFSSAVGVAASGLAVQEPVDLHGLRVLIIDDNATHREILHEMFLAWRMRPVTVGSAEEALTEAELAAEAGQPFQAALADSGVDPAGGPTLVERLRQHPGLSGPVILMLASAGGPLGSERWRTAGAQAAILKPLKQSELLDTLLSAVTSSPGVPRRQQLPAGPSLSLLPPLRVLLAEDNPVNQRLAARLLEKAGHSVHVAANGKLALEALAEAPFDLVLMDVQMPEMGGLEATQALRARERTTGGHVPVIALTAHAMKGDRERCLAAGMDGYVTKPIREQDLYAAILQALSDLAPQMLTPPLTPPAQPSALPLHDEAEALTRCGGDRALLGELVDMFLAEVPRWTSSLEAALAAGDAETLHRGAHSIKGAVATFGAEEARAAALALEVAAREKRLADAPAALAALKEALARLCPALSQLRP